MGFGWRILPALAHASALALTSRKLLTELDARLSEVSVACTAPRLEKQREGSGEGGLVGRCSPSPAQICSGVGCQLRRSTFHRSCPQVAPGVRDFLCLPSCKRAERSAQDRAPHAAVR